jgi:uncharacterized alpha-E superfamily protein
MLLSSAAEAMFWTGRYIERAQALARTVQAYERLSLDLPGVRSLDARPLLGLVGYEALRDTGSIADTSGLLRALVLDVDNPSSVMGALCQARENLRRGRVATPPEVWTTLNALYVRRSEVDAEQTASVLGVLEEVVAAGSRIEGELTASMTRDAAYSFLRIGCHLERADMQLRTMKAFLPVIGPSGPERVFDDVRWMGLLDAVAAHSMYRRHHHTHVDLPAVLEFLVLEAPFPRSLAHCFHVIDEELLRLPRHREAREAECIARHVASALAGTSAAALPVRLSLVLSALAELHAALKASYFPDPPQPPLPILPPRAEAQTVATTPPPSQEFAHVAAVDPLESLGREPPIDVVPQQNGSIPNGLPRNRPMVPAAAGGVSEPIVAATYTP